MLDEVRQLELYHDTETENPRTDPDELRERLAEVAEKHGLDHRATDIADDPEEECAECYESLVENAGSEEYHVGNRMFTPHTFGSLRPALVIRYEDDDLVDIYPHQNDAVGNSPVTVHEFLDELDPDETSKRGDYAWLRNRREGTDDGEEETEESQAEQKSDDGEGFVSTIRQLVP